MTISTNIHFGLCLLCRTIYPVPAVQIFHFQDGGDVKNPVGLSLRILPQKCKSGPMPLSRAKNWQQKSTNRALFPLCPQGQPPGVAADMRISMSSLSNFKFLYHMTTLPHLNICRFPKIISYKCFKQLSHYITQQLGPPVGPVVLALYKLGI